MEQKENQKLIPNFPVLLIIAADLIALMDKYGIGTDATHAEHIETIKTRQYAALNNDGRFVPGYIGLALVDGYDQMGYAMSKPHMRADLESQLKLICLGQRLFFPCLILIFSLFHSLNISSLVVFELSECKINCQNSFILWK